MHVTYMIVYVTIVEHVSDMCGICEWQCVWHMCDKVCGICVTCMACHVWHVNFYI